MADSDSVVGSKSQSASNGQVLVRRFQRGEEHLIRQIYFDTTHQIVAQNYSQEQVHRWAPVQYDKTAWEKRLVSTNPFVAVRNDTIVGFAELLSDGRIDLFYCHHAFQRQGIGRALLQRLESEAVRRRQTKLTAQVSTTGVQFFSRMGFQTTQETNKIVCGQAATQFHMSKTLTDVVADV